MRSLEQSLPLKLLRAREAVMDHFRPHLLAHDITEQQWRVIRALAEGGPLDAGHLARRVCLLMPSLSRILRDLEKAGLLKRLRDLDDGRLVIVHLTARGKTLFQKMSKESEQIYRALEDAIGPDRFKTLSAEIEDLITLLHDLPRLDQTGIKQERTQKSVALAQIK